MLDLMRKKEPKIATLETPLHISDFATTGQGIGTLKSDLSIDQQTYTEFNGVKVLLWNALPDELVTKFQVVTQKPHFIEGIALEITKQSTSRVNPRDEQFLSTSPWQILNEDAELTAKSRILTSLFEYLGNTHPINKQFTSKILVHQSPNNYFYRNKMEYSLYYNHETEKIQLAVHYRGSHRKMPIKKSSLELPNILVRANQIIDELNRTKQEARTFQSLLLRANQSGEVSGGLLENGKSHPSFKKLTDNLLGNSYSYSPSGFFQINLPVYEAALLKIKDFLFNSASVLDLYAGVGTIGLSVARDKNLTLIEVNKSAFGELEANATHVTQTTQNFFIKPILAKSEEVLDQITNDTSVILDPPRAGCDKKLINRLCEIKPEKIVYLSCNPITQVRDLNILLTQYTISSIEAFNFFPRTPHIESLVLLTRK